MGRTVLGRSHDLGYNFKYLADLSRNKFTNVSVNKAVVDNLTSSMLGFLVVAPIIWIWGSGRYRASAVYLAASQFVNLETLQGIRYFAGDNKWSSNEDDAVALVCEDEVGELSASWHPFLECWVLMFNSGNSPGILMYSAR